MFSHFQYLQMNYVNKSITLTPFATLRASSDLSRQGRGVNFLLLQCNFKFNFISNRYPVVAGQGDFRLEAARQFDGVRMHSGEPETPLLPEAQTRRIIVRGNQP